MKWAVVILALAMGGCTTVAELQATPPTMSVISGKTPKVYSDCVVTHLEGSRKPSLVEPHKVGYRIVVPQKLSQDPGAVIDVEKTSNGSNIKLYEHMANMPIRPKDVSKAVTACISGA